MLDLSALHYLSLARCLFSFAYPSKLYLCSFHDRSFRTVTTFLWGNIPPAAALLAPTPKDPADIAQEVCGLGWGKNCSWFSVWIQTAQPRSICRTLTSVPSRNSASSLLGVAPSQTAGSVLDSRQSLHVTESGWAAWTSQLSSVCMGHVPINSLSPHTGNRATHSRKCTFLFCLNILRLPWSTGSKGARGSAQTLHFAEVGLGRVPLVCAPTPESPGFSLFPREALPGGAPPHPRPRLLAPGDLVATGDFTESATSFSVSLSCSGLISEMTQGLEVSLLPSLMECLFSFSHSF